MGGDKNSTCTRNVLQRNLSHFQGRLLFLRCKRHLYVNTHTTVKMHGISTWLFIKIKGKICTIISRYQDKCISHSRTLLRQIGNDHQTYFCLKIKTYVQLYLSFREICLLADFFSPYTVQKYAASSYTYSKQFKHTLTKWVWTDFFYKAQSRTHTHTPSHTYTNTQAHFRIGKEQR